MAVLVIKGMVGGSLRLFMGGTSLRLCEGRVELFGFMGGASLKLCEGRVELFGIMGGTPLRLCEGRVAPEKLMIPWNA